MNSKMEQNNGVKFEQLVEAAKNNDWGFVDENINESHLSYEYTVWAIKDGLLDKDRNVRDLAATILDKSNEQLDPEDAKEVERIMLRETYHIVIYRLAIALYKRGIRNTAIERLMSEAKDDPDVGDLAKSFLAQ
ncbi:MAG: hypothetical protein V1896_00690 [Candidatus Zambryskibacteria bacterium]